ncbi:aspartate/glutamate racemase family protein [Aneurinibacillus sp. REN35]|uniref:aspartate/glutamate racemase family protein n=1 Tax=Aneurinibacillus sp. REN35 TaxID=3237286 RepID=UPI00352802C6
MKMQSSSDAKIGILMLDTTFPRMKGDIGNPATFPFPVMYKVIPGATVKRVVHEHDAALLEPFIEAAQELEAHGVQAITTSCGFLALFQKEIAAKVSVSFYSSSLLQVPLVYTVAGTGGSIGIITANQSSLSPRHITAAGIADLPIHIAGMEECPSFRQSILEGAAHLDKQAIEEEIVQKAKEMKETHPDMKAIVLECTNMPPYRDRIKQDIQLPVFDIVTLTHYIYDALP